MPIDIINPFSKVRKLGVRAEMQAAELAVTCVQNMSGEALWRNQDAFPHSMERWETELPRIPLFPETTKPRRGEVSQ